MLRPFEVNSNAIEIIVHTSCCCILDYSLLQGKQAKSIANLCQLEK